MTTLEYLGDYSLATSLSLAVLVAALCAWLYFRNLRDAPTLHRWLLPVLRAAALILCLLMLAGPTLRHRAWHGNPNRVTILLDATPSMRWSDDVARETGAKDNGANNDGANDNGAARSRYERATRLLLAEDAHWLKTLARRSQVVVTRFAGAQSVPLWTSSLDASQPPPTDGGPWLPPDWLAPTALGDVLAAVESPETAPEGATPDRAGPNGKATDDAAPPERGDCVVLFTDGRSHAGRAPLEAARRLAAQHCRLFTLGYGHLQEPTDLAVTGVQCAERLLKTDLLRGEMTWKEQAPVGQPLKLAIHAGDTLLWETTVTSRQSQRERIEFSIPVRELPLPAPPDVRGMEVHEQTVALRATIEALDAPGRADASNGAGAPLVEIDMANNARSFHVRVVTRQYRVLILDGRARWETRYLRHALERDPNWMVDAFILDGVSEPRAFSASAEERSLPTTFEQLLDYDLLILGELPMGALPSAVLDGLPRYVGDLGGGLLVIDGARGLLRDAAWQTLHRLLPVQWTGARAGQLSEPTRLRLTPAGEPLAALRLDASTGADVGQIWRDLPGITFAAPVEAHPGSETLVALADEAASPLLVTQRWGAGRVVYLATDETWRWRYGVADRYHQRWWNQLARWAMRTPFAVQNEFLQLTTDRAQYAPADTVQITARLSDEQGRGASSGDVQAVCRRTGDASSDVRSVSLQPDESIAGLYRGTLSGLPAGSYALSITAAGIPQRSLALTCPIAVVEPADPELQELSCNEPLLRELAETTGGVYLHEDEGERLLDLLLPLSQAESVETQTALAESYFWFVPIVVLLGIEWWLRKRAGLL